MGKNITLYMDNETVDLLAKIDKSKVNYSKLFRKAVISYLSKQSENNEILSKIRDIHIKLCIN